MDHATSRGDRLVQASPENVFIITLDTTRADVLSAYGATIVETPAIDRLAREGTVFEQASTTVPLTLPAHSTLFTGPFPHHHGVHDNTDPPLGRQYPTLAEVFRAEGLHSAAFVASAVLDSRRGLARGFELYSEGHVPRSSSRLRRRGDVVTDEAIDWIGRQRSSPFFAWIHLYDAHAPYKLPQPYRTMYADAPYLGAIRSWTPRSGDCLAHSNGTTFWTRRLSSS